MALLSKLFAVIFLRWKVSNPPCVLLLVGLLVALGSCSAKSALSALKAQASNCLGKSVARGVSRACREVDARPVGEYDLVPGAVVQKTAP